MSQVLFEQESDVETTFTLKNRGEQRLEDYVAVEDLQVRLDMIREHNWQPQEITYFASLQTAEGERVFSDPFLDYLRTNTLPPVNVRHDGALDDLAIDATGPAALTTFWETVIMSELNELYFENYVRSNKLDLMAIYEEGDRRLSEKITILQANPAIKFADFGTRRHFSLRWQRHVLQRLQSECPDNFIGTSNVALANTLGTKPIGTFAHEMPMTYAALADARGDDIRASHNTMLRDWYARYGEDLSIALTDTFGSEFFFDDFTPEQAADWRGVRHDSGDPVEFAKRVIAFYEANDIDPLDKTLVFSDGLDIDQIVTLQEKFGDRINVLFGWGTSLTNDLGLKSLNIVAKVTHVKTAEGQEADAVKLSDNPGKHTGPEQKVKQYEHEFRKLSKLCIAA
jgi:nicotinate phosphoribosyltransferase